MVSDLRRRPSAAPKSLNADRRTTLAVVENASNGFRRKSKVAPKEKAFRVLYCTALGILVLVVLVFIPLTRKAIVQLVLLGTPAKYHLAAPALGNSIVKRFRAPPIVIGTREHTDYQWHLDSDEFLSALNIATLRPDAPSRTLNDRVEKSMDLLMEHRFHFGFTIDSTILRTYNSHQACDLLAQHGGVFIRGDKSMRHFVHALFMLLSEDVCGAVHPCDEKCEFEGVFMDDKRCHEHMLTDSEDATEPLCDGDAHIRFIEQETNEAKDRDIDDYTRFHSRLPADKQTLSPLIIQSSGRAYNYDSQTALQDHIKPVLQLLSTVPSPKPLTFWFNQDHPGLFDPLKGGVTPELAKEMREDAIMVARYNKEVSSLVKTHTKQGIAKMRVLDFYNVTKGASQVDSEHYGFQVAMEKVQVFLNLLDILHGEVERQYPTAKKP